LVTKAKEENVPSEAERKFAFIVGFAKAIDESRLNYKVRQKFGDDERHLTQYVFKKMTGRMAKVSQDSNEAIADRCRDIILQILDGSAKDIFNDWDI
jgi:hypothetical protein